jgi:hypothetical protein
MDRNILPQTPRTIALPRGFHVANIMDRNYWPQTQRTIALPRGLYIANTINRNNWPQTPRTIALRPLGKSIVRAVLAINYVSLYWLCKCL